MAGCSMRRCQSYVGMVVGLVLFDGGFSPLASQPADRAPTGNPLRAIPLQDLRVSRERPPVSPSRRPPPSFVTVAPPAAAPTPRAVDVPQSPDLVLVGTVINGTDGLAVFLDQNTNAVVRLRMGDDHNGWILRSLQGREAILQRGR